MAPRTIVTATNPAPSATFVFPHHVGEALAAMQFVGAILERAVDAERWNGELARRLDPDFEGWPEVMGEAYARKGAYSCPMTLKVKWLPSERGQNSEGEEESCKVLQATAFWGMGGVKTGVVLRSYTSSYGEHWQILRSWSSRSGDARHGTSWKLEVEGDLYWDRGNCTPRDQVRITWDEGWSPEYPAKYRLASDASEEM